MRFRKRPKIAHKLGSLERVDLHFARIAETARRRALSRLRAEKASPARIKAEMTKLDDWLRDWRSRSPGIRARKGDA